MNGVSLSIALVVIMVIALLLSFQLSYNLTKRAICRVVNIFRFYNAVDYQKALPLEALGLGPRPLFSFRILRDYKPWALRTLAQAGVIRMAEEGLYYLSDETLRANPEIMAVCRSKVKVKNQPGLILLVIVAMYAFQNG
jgi:hypothetical protein